MVELTLVLLFPSEEHYPGPESITQWVEDALDCTVTEFEEAFDV